MDPIIPIIPQNSLKDTIAILIIFLSLPSFLSILVFILFILTSSSKSFALKLVTKLFRTSNSKIDVDDGINSNSVIGATDDTELTETNEESSNHFISSIVLIGLFDICLFVILKVSSPNLIKLVIVLSKSIVATSLSGYTLKNSILSSIWIILFDFTFKNSIIYINNRFGNIIGSDDKIPILFPNLTNFNFPIKELNWGLSSYLNKLISNHHDYNYYLIKLITSYLLNFINLILSIHVILMAFASISKTNFITKNLNQLSKFDQDIVISLPFSSYLLNKEKNSKNSKIVEIEISNTISQSKLSLQSDDQLEDNVMTPASFTSTIEQISNSIIVSENFKIFCKSSINKSKNSIKSIQPLWSLIATIKAMSLRKDHYSGLVQIDSDDNNNKSLVLSDYVNKYDDYKILNYDEDFYKKNEIVISINYIGETLISFNLTNFKKGDIIVRVNGVIWYQVLTGFTNDELHLIVGGLTPLSQYDVQFIVEEEVEDEESGNLIKKKFLIDDLIVSTVDSEGYDIIQNNNEKSIINKPFSPLITLQDSLITTNDNIVKEKFKLKKTRKEISKKNNSIKNDIEILKNKISNNDKNDEKNWKKIITLRNFVKQVEKDVDLIESEITQYEIKENEMVEIYSVEKRKYDLILRNYQNFKNSILNENSERTNSIQQLDLEIDSLISKRDKLVNKLDKLKTDVSKLDKDIKSLQTNDQLLRDQSRTKRANRRTLMLNEFKKEIEKIQEGVLTLSTENEALREG